MRYFLEIFFCVKKLMKDLELKMYFESIEQCIIWIHL